MDVVLAKVLQTGRTNRMAVGREGGKEVIYKGDWLL
jgi:hypothetical protein